MEIVPLGQRELDALTDLARRPDVVRYGDHLELDPPSVFAAWLGEPDANRQLSLGARRGGALIAAARLSTIPRRRRTHVGVVELLAPWGEDGDAAVDALLGALVDAADRWMQLVRLELIAPAGHPRVEGVYAARGFSVETTMRASIRRDGALADEVALARIRPGTRSLEPVAGPPVPRAKAAPPGALRFRPIHPVRDAEAWTAALSDESVLWGTLQLPHQHPETWERKLASNDPRQLVAIAAEVDGALAGGAVLLIGGPLRRRHAATLGMHVHPEHQGRGVGGRLMQELLAVGDRLGLTRIELEVFPDNPRAVRIYEAAGFALEGRRHLSCFRDGALIDDLMMSRVKG